MAGKWVWTLGFRCRRPLFRLGRYQPEESDADVGIVLHPDYWGLGKEIFDRIIAFVFEENGFESVIILLPPSRTRVKAMLRLGFQPDGESEISGERFIRFRLYNR